MRFILALAAVALMAGCSTTQKQKEPEVGDSLLMEAVSKIIHSPTKVKWPVNECLRPVAGMPEVEICYHESAKIPDGYQGETVLFDHGYTSDARVLMNDIYDPLKKELLKRPTRFVVVSWGKSWMLRRERGIKQPTATLSNWRDRVLPAIERTWPQVKSPTGKYKLLGHSMGGSNAATQAAVYPELFSKVALVQPMLVRDSQDILAKPSLLDTILGKTCLACYVVRDSFADQASWVAERPSTVANALMPPVWMSACKDDMFKLRDAELEYGQRLRDLGVDVTVVDLKKGCDHQTQDVAGLIRHLEL